MDKKTKKYIEYIKKEISEKISKILPEDSHFKIKDIALNFDNSVCMIEIELQWNYDVRLSYLNKIQNIFNAEDMKIHNTIYNTCMLSTSRIKYIPEKNVDEFA